MKPFKYNPDYNSGSFRHRITFQEEAEGYDEDGFPTEGWTDKSMQWAMVKTLNAREFYAVGQTMNEAKTRFVIRYTEGIHDGMRIMYNGKAYEIETIINDDLKNETLTIPAREITPDGVVRS